MGLWRPYLFSLTSGYGEAGLRRMVQLLRKELKSNMARAGAAEISQISPEIVDSQRLESDVTGSVKLRGFSDELVVVEMRSWATPC